MELILNKGQMNVFKKGKEWWKSENKFDSPFIIQGRPGTGKTTIIHLLIEHLKIPLDDIVFCTFVGRATLPLILTGLNAKTIHSTCYELIEVNERDENGKIVKDEFGNNVIKKIFRKKESLPKNIKLIVVDEGGMVATPMCNDLESFGVPIIVAGDIDQLPPVFGKSKWMLNPTVILNEIMRQKQGDPIIYLAELARQGIDIHTGKYGNRCYVVDEDILRDKRIYTKPDIIICAKNKTRDNINDLIRYQILKYKTDTPVIGDKLVCRKNNWDEFLPIKGMKLSLVNGLFGYVRNIYPETYNRNSFNIDFSPEMMHNDWFENLQIDLKYIKIKEAEIRKKYNTGFSNGEIFEYGYSSTCHMAQGSQYGYSMVVDEDFGRESFHNKFLYTAITRAKHTLVLVKKKRKPKIFIPGW